MNKELTKEEMIDALVEYHIRDIISGSIVELEFLSDVLRGDGWVPYNQLTDEQIKAQYEELIGDDKK
tara:strand:+ start:55 stop:255 length:201 start_codon:yes stop_codon:yes gene_type:complete